MVSTDVLVPVQTRRTMSEPSPRRPAHAPPWAPRYELRLVGGDVVDPPLLVWSRHRVRALATVSLRLERSGRDLGRSRLVLWDRWRRRVLGS